MRSPNKIQRIQYKVKDFIRKKRKVLRNRKGKLSRVKQRYHHPSNLVLAAGLSAASVIYYSNSRWLGLPLSLGVIVLCIIQIFRLRERERRKLKELASKPEVEVDDYLAYLYQCFPLRAVSRIFGVLSEKELPKPLLNRFLSLYCKYFNVRLEEANIDSIDSYKTVAEFFQRELKPTVRIIHDDSPLVVPCDGRVLHFGKCKEGVVEQVKGVRYSVERFLGKYPVLSDSQNNDLFYCVIYLAPGDYHLFHSPCSWTIDKVIHFPGTLMSVNPKICKLVRGVFTLNERVLLTGTWSHGFFSYTAVGATGVGSIKINFLKDKIKTNKGFLTFLKDTEIEVSPEVTLEKGGMLGGFNFGSTIVLMFEAPKDFQFNLEADQRIQMGDKLGSLDVEDST